MSNPFVSRVGGIMSGDIAVPEHEREVKFYSRVLTTGETPLWQEDLMNNMGMPVIGLGVRTPDYESLPLQWMPHFQVADVAASAQSALDLGGTEVIHGKDDQGNSQWAVFQDPNGAAFGMIPVVPSEMIPPIDESAGPIGSIAWVDLTVPAASETRDFYSQVIGWSVEEAAMDDNGESYADFIMNGGDGNAAAGVCHARGANADLPGVWLFYLPVGDIAESIRRAEEEGGKVIKTMSGADGTPAVAVIQDPVGVHFAIVPGT